MTANISFKKTVLITGANGFIGRALIDSLLPKETYIIHAVTRTINELPLHRQIKAFQIETINDKTNWNKALTDCDTVVHTAARVHVMQDKAADPLTEFRKINVDGTLNLAQQAIKKGIKRFIFLSSIKVNGEKTVDHPFKATDTPNPSDPYAISKCEAEKKLTVLCKNSTMELIIIRPPLVYGSEAKGNFYFMVSMIKKGYPLPLKNIQNKRSLISIDNLVDLIEKCIQHAAQLNQIFLVSDNEDLSTSELIDKISKVLNKRIWMFSVPKRFLSLLAKLTGQRTAIERLYDSLQVDITETQRMLDWSPIVSVDKALTNALRIKGR